MATSLCRVSTRFPWGQHRPVVPPLRPEGGGDPEAAPRGAHSWTVCLTGATPPRAVSRPGTGGTGHPASPAPGSAEALLPGRDVGEVHVGRDHHPDAPLLALQGTKEEPCSLAATAEPEFGAGHAYSLARGRRASLEGARSAGQQHPERRGTHTGGLRQKQVLPGICGPRGRTCRGSCWVARSRGRSEPTQSR